MFSPNAGSLISKKLGKVVGAMLNFSEQFTLAFFLKSLPKDSEQRNTGAAHNFLPADDHPFSLPAVCS